MRNKTQKPAEKKAVLFATFNRSREMSPKIETGKTPNDELPEFELYYPLERKFDQSKVMEESKAINLRNYLDSHVE